MAISAVWASAGAVCAAASRSANSGTTWANGLPDGRGEAVYADGSRYEGGFLAGRRDGAGTYYFAAPGGETFTGEWRDDAVVEEDGGVGRAAMPSGRAVRVAGAGAAGAGAFAEYHVPIIAETVFRESERVDAAGWRDLLRELAEGDDGDE